jgi:hypothetical protein
MWGQWPGGASTALCMTSSLISFATSILHVAFDAEDISVIVHELSRVHFRSANLKAPCWHPKCMVGFGSDFGFTTISLYFMQYWRMQLHPGDSARSTEHCLRSLSAGLIGLDFRSDPGDLRKASKEDVESKERDYFDFALRMKEGDKVLIISHHYPLALVRIDGDYNYITNPAPEIGVWFRHFRRITDLSLYFDCVRNPTKWQRTTMTDTISILKDPQSDSYNLIKNWK